MNKIRNRWVTAVLAVIIVMTSSGVFASDNFAKVKLPRGVSIELPKNWIVLSENQRITLDSAVESGLDLSGMQIEGELPFAANHYDDKGNTLGIINIRYYPQIELTQIDARAATDQDVIELDAALKENMLKSVKAFGTTIPSWQGTKKASINDITTFITEYRRSSIKGAGEFRVRLVRVFAGNKSFTLTVSYNESAAFLLKPITDRVINSLKLEGIEKNSSIVTPSSESTLNHKTSLMTELYGEQWWLVLFISFLFTWGVGLAPPLLIRFVFMRRPIVKGWAIGIAGLFLFINLVLFTALGSQSKSHGALLLVALVSYSILRKGAKKQAEKVLDET